MPRHAPIRLSSRLLLLPLLLAALVTVSGGRAQPAFAQSPALAAARTQEFNGDWEGAEAEYRRLMQDGGDNGQAARLELARLLERFERYDDALDTLKPLLDQSPSNERLVRAWFQNASVLQSLGRGPDAIAAYGRYIQLNGPAAAYARVESAKLYMGNSDTGPALDLLDPLLKGNGPEHARRVALRVAAPGAEDFNRPNTALEYYRQLTELGQSYGERAMAWWKVGTLERGRGNTAQAVEAYRTLVTAFPDRREAEDALTALDQLGRPAAAQEAGLVQYRRGNNDTARQTFNAVLADGASVANRGVALFYLGALAERRNEPQLAIENYTESYDADPNGRLAADALWWSGLIYEETGDTTSAQRQYARIVERFPEFWRAAEAAFRNGFYSYAGGRIGDARDRWSVAMRQSAREVASTGAFWAGKAASDAGDRTAAQSAWSEAVRRDPSGYYGLRAAAMLAGQPQAPRSGPATLRVTAPDWAAAEGWLASWAGPEGAGAWQSYQSGEEWRAMQELLAAGWTRIASDAFTVATVRRQEQPWALYRISRALSDAGLPNVSMAAARLLVGRAPADAPAAAIPIQRLAYPLPWQDLVQRFADQRGVDPLLVYAMMRQESAFNPAAGSSAGAFGLTQVVAPTGEEIARALGKSDFRFSDLARPALAIEFGAFYLGAQIRDQEGSVYRGLAAYNAGGGSAYRWVRNSGSSSDVDRFAETIDYSETELYVRVVTENYAWYRYLYGAAERPSVVR